MENFSRIQCLHNQPALRTLRLPILMLLKLLKTIQDDITLYSNSLLTDNSNGGLAGALSGLVDGTHSVGAAVLLTQLHNVESHIPKVVDHIDSGA